MENAGDDSTQVRERAVPMEPSELGVQGFHLRGDLQQYG